MKTPLPPFNPVTIAPTFDNARTLERVLRQIEEQGVALIVVDDGSVDETAAILRRWQAEETRRVVVTHPRNRGKAAALRSGFARAGELGFSHAVTIDTDGQLDPAEIPNLLRMARRSPRALIIGRRAARAENYPAISRLGRWASNVLVQWESGERVSDSQCGFRVYPLAEVSDLPCRSQRYGFETEILTRAAWSGVPVKECRVGCTYKVPEGRVSHFRPWIDSLASARMHLRLLTVSLVPWPDRARRHLRPSASRGRIWQRFFAWINPMRAWRAVQQDPAERPRFAIALSLGVFIANTPFFGVQTLISLFCARRLRLNPLPIIIGSHLSTPPIGPLLIAAAVTMGHLFLHGSLPSLKSFDPAATGYGPLIRSLLLEWTLGGIFCGALLAGVTFLLTNLLLRWVPLRKPADPAAHPAAPAPVLVHEAVESVV